MRINRLLSKRTKIVVTIGPVSGKASVIERLITSGMNVARLNLAHGTPQTHARYITTIRRVSQRLGIRVAILMDLPGPKYRTGKLSGGQVALRRGAKVTLTSRDVAGDSSLVSVNLPYLARNVKTGDEVLIDDGAIQLRVIAVKGEEVECRVVVGGVLTELRGLVVPGMRRSVPFLTDEMQTDISFAVSQNPDYVALSFVSQAEDVAEVKQLLQENGADIPVVTKIERGIAVTNFDRILAASDGIMVARGDLGVDIPLERVPLVQKEIIRKCNLAGKPVITATQMLESMISAARPTRAEVTDVANAIFDGTDATMLSAETSIGRYPVRAVTTMAKIACETEKRLPYEQMLKSRGNSRNEQIDEMIAYNACRTAHYLRAVAIVAFTQSGSTASRVSKYRPGVPILATTTSDVVAGRLMLYWGVYPFAVGETLTLDDLFTSGARLARDLHLAKPGDLIVITGGIPIGVAGSTNLLKVEQIGL